uniref:DM domain-containing protein n=1 Tax=Seriola lalandi dorsalis TaxID=1841481 RepID=A0A3B4XVR4_SERLL
MTNIFTSKDVNTNLKLGIQEPEPRRPKCTRCRHHGIIVPQKGHMKFCPFLKCDCWKCYLITQRTQIATLQRNLRKAERNPHEKQQQQQRTSAPHCFSGRKPAAPGTPSASGPDGGARPSLTSGLMSPRSTGAPGSAASMTRSPLDPRGRLALGGEHVAGLGSKELLPLSSSEEGALSKL